MVLSYVKRFLRLYAGLFLCAVSILLAIQGGVGVTPWDVFHMGIQNITGISYGTVNILVGLCILTTSIVLGEPIGFGTLCNTLSVGYMVDFLKWLNWVPAAPNAIAGCGMMVLSLFVLAMGSFLYIGAGMGCGPRDSMMTAFSKRLTKVPVGLIRGTIETVVLIIGFFLGGPVGIGTVIGMFGIGRRSRSSLTSSTSMCAPSGMSRCWTLSAGSRARLPLWLPNRQNKSPAYFPRPLHTIESKAAPAPRPGRFF